MTSAALERRAPAVRLVPLAVVAALAAMGCGLLAGSAPAERWQLAARYTARLSFPIFTLAFCARPLARLWPTDSTRALLRARRAVGLAFAAAHTVHLAALASFFAVSGQSPNPTTLWIGGGAYLAMFAMVATSSDRAVRALGARWRWLHTVGAYWLWLAFAGTYAGRVAGGRFELAPQLLLALGSVGLRIAARRRR